MTLARLSDSGELLPDLGRRRADSQGWYNAHRSLQAGVVGSSAAVGEIVVIIAVWRVPEPAAATYRQLWSSSSWSASPVSD